MLHCCLRHGDPVIFIGVSVESVAFEDEGGPVPVVGLKELFLSTACLPDVVAFAARDFATFASGRCLGQNSRDCHWYPPPGVAVSRHWLI